MARDSARPSSSRRLRPARWVGLRAATAYYEHEHNRLPRCLLRNIARSGCRGTVWRTAAQEESRMNIKTDCSSRWSPSSPGPPPPCQRRPPRTRQLRTSPSPAATTTTTRPRPSERRTPATPTASTARTCRVRACRPIRAPAGRPRRAGRARRRRSQRHEASRRSAAGLR
jgi:hypothetical protein